MPLRKGIGIPRRAPWAGGMDSRKCVSGENGPSPAYLAENIQLNFFLALVPKRSYYRSLTVLGPPR